MELFSKKTYGWETLEKEINEAINLIKQLREKNKILLEEKKKLEEEKKTFETIKRNMEIKINKLIERLSSLKE